MMSAPKEKAEGDRIDARSFEFRFSFELVDKKINRGNNAANSTKGPTTAASLELVKNTATKNDKLISDMANKKKNRKISILFEVCRKEKVVISVVLSAIQKKSMNDVRNQES